MKVTTIDRRDLRRRTYDVSEVIRKAHGWHLKLADGVATVVVWDDYTDVKMEDV